MVYNQELPMDDTLQHNAPPEDLSDHLADIKAGAAAHPAAAAARDMLTVKAAPPHLGSLPEIPATELSAIPAEELEQLTADIVGALKTVYDPEIPCDIYELGLIYKIDIDDNRACTVDMTLTAPGCPVAGEMPIWVENAVNSVAGIAGTTVNLTFDPPWDKSRMSDEARLALNMF
jgi:FeS assembly SUF system protein